MGRRDSLQQSLLEAQGNSLCGPVPMEDILEGLPVVVLGSAVGKGSIASGCSKEFIERSAAERHNTGQVVNVFLCEGESLERRVLVRRATLYSSRNRFL